MNIGVITLSNFGAIGYCSSSGFYYIHIVMQKVDT